MEERASGRQAHQRIEVEAPEMRQQILLLEHQQVQGMDASEKLKFECRVSESCGMQRDLENRLLAGI
eukprot:9534540-Prorocentrum_lima.AAC.1